MRRARCTYAITCVTWRIHVCDVTHSSMWRDAFLCVTWRIHICDVTHSYVSWLFWIYVSFACICCRRMQVRRDIWWQFICVMTYLRMTYIICFITHLHMFHDSFHMFHASPQTEEIGLQIITTAKISNEFSRESPYISNTFSGVSPNFQTNFHVSKRSPRHSKDLTGKLLDLKIQISWVRSPPWAVSYVFMTHLHMCFILICVWLISYVSWLICICFMNNFTFFMPHFLCFMTHLHMRFMIRFIWSMTYFICFMTHFTCFMPHFICFMTYLHICFIIHFAWSMTYFICFMTHFICFMAHLLSMSHLHMFHDPFHMLHDSYVWREAFIRATDFSCHTYAQVMSLTMPYLHRTFPAKEPYN